MVLGEGRVQNKPKDIQLLPELTEIIVSDVVKMEASRLYVVATNGKIKRNTPRRAIIYCCLIIACRQYAVIFDKSSFQNVLNIKNRDINKAVKEVAPLIGSIEITIDDLIRYTLIEFNVRESQLADILDIYNYCKDKSTVFNSSKIETLAAGLVFNYLVLNYNEFEPEQYFEKSKVSKDNIIAVHNDIIKYTIDEE